MDLTLTESRARLSGKDKRAIAGAVAGTVFEWYDFVLYGSLADVIAANFFTGIEPGTAFIFALMTFSVGFVVRPLGAVIFGRLGDMIGRKKTFMTTVMLMGLATCAVALTPGYASIGVAAPIILVLSRILQGFAVGGEFGGAATYVAEHSPQNRRGRNTSLIQATASTGLLGALIVTIATRILTGPDFAVWGWRIPFSISILLLIVSLALRRKMDESPAFERARAAGVLSRRPVRDSLRGKNLAKVMVALFGICGGMTVVWYVVVIYPLFFLTRVLKVDANVSNLLVAIAMLAAIPMLYGCGALSDRFGRKPVLLIGYLLAALTIFPVFRAITHYANPALEQAQIANPAVVHADPHACAFMFDPAGVRSFSNACDIAKKTLSAASVNYSVVGGGASELTTVTIGNDVIRGFDATGLDAAGLKAKATDFSHALSAALIKAGYPQKAAPQQFHFGAVLLLMLLLIFVMSLTYAPIAAILVEMFPTELRYTSMSIPFHVASGWIGGLLPALSFAIAAAQGNIYAGLWYPMFWVGLALVVTAFAYRESRGVDIFSTKAPGS
ncbi:MFS transporter [Caballeronia sp. dw_19]|jgi:MFS family permease|uniref:MFS transporter n=1 Tax=unclassified Caballeronia TaxID=2646786 RepID=UPI001BD1B84B|nr:MFS transporter [Caballeronia sp. dw_19]